MIDFWFYLILAMSSSYSLRAIGINGVVSKQSRRSICFRVGLFACSFAGNMSVTSRGNLDSILAAVALLDSSPVAQTERAIVLHSVSVSND